MNQELMTLDFWQDTVIYEGKTFPVGTLYSGIALEHHRIRIFWNFFKLQGVGCGFYSKLHIFQHIVGSKDFFNPFSVFWSVCGYHPSRRGCGKARQTDALCIVRGNVPV